MPFDLISMIAVFCSSILAAMGLGGGSVLLLYLSLATSLSQPIAQAVNLLLFLPAAALSLLIHRKNGLVSWHYLKPCLPGGILGGLAGSLLGNQLSPALLGRLFGVFLLFIGVRELFQAVRLIRKG